MGSLKLPKICISYCLKLHLNRVLQLFPFCGNDLQREGFGNVVMFCFHEVQKLCVTVGIAFLVTYWPVDSTAGGGVSVLSDAAESNKLTVRSGMEGWGWAYCQTIVTWVTHRQSR